MSLLRLKAEAAPTFGPAQLMGEVVLPLLEHQREAAPGVEPSPGALVSLVVEGEGGGAWTVDLDAAEAYEGRAEDPDCLLRLSRAAFEDLVRGRLDAEEATSSGALKCFGDPDLLVRFARLLQGQPFGGRGGAA